MMYSIRTISLVACLASNLIFPAVSRAAPELAAGRSEGDASSLERDPAFDAVTEAGLLPEFVLPTTRDHIGRVVVPVTVNGQGPFRFVVDTGASHSVLAADLVARLALPLTADTVLLKGVTGSAMVGSVRIETLQVGKLQMGSRSLAVIDAELGGADGVLGTDGLEGMRITVDFRKDFVHIARSALQPAPRFFFTVPVTFGFGRLLVADAQVGNVAVKAIIDTGAERTLGNPALRRALTFSRNARSRAASADIEGVTADFQTGDLIAAPTISLGAVKINSTDVTFGDMHVFKIWGYERRPALLVGMDVLGVIDVLIIDYRRGEIQILPSQCRGLACRSPRPGRLTRYLN